jgi:hypothetical protein
MADELAWRRPGLVTDPIWMEYVLREIEVEASIKNELATIQFQTLANVHKAFAEGAQSAAEALSKASRG